MGKVKDVSYYDLDDLATVFRLLQIAWLLSADSKMQAERNKLNVELLNKKKPATAGFENSQPL